MDSSEQPNVDSVDFTNADELDNPDEDDEEEGEAITSKKVSIFLLHPFYLRLIS